MICRNYDHAQRSRTPGLSLAGYRKEQSLPCLLQHPRPTLSQVKARVEARKRSVRKKYKERPRNIVRLGFHDVSWVRPILCCAGTTLHPEPNKLTRPASTYHARTPSYLPHPYQPSPSPSQLNNPGIYAGVPPPNYNRPQNTQSGSILSPWLRR